MKEKELRECATCSVCRRKVGQTGIGLIFWRVRLERYVIDLRACERQTGLAMMLGGNGVLAAAMGPDEDLAKQLVEKTVPVCDECMTYRFGGLVALTEEDL